MKTISSRQNPVVRAFRDLAHDPDPAGARLLLDGAHLVRDAAAAGISFDHVCIAVSHLDRHTEEARIAEELAREGVEVTALPDAVFDSVSPVRTPSGLVAIGHRQPSTAEQVFTAPSPLVLVAVDVQDPGNVGAVLRVAEAAGATGACVTTGSANPFSWKALRGSMGSALRLPIAIGLTTGDILSGLAAHGVRTIASVPRGGEDPDRVRWDGSTALIIGGEGPGLAETVVDACDACVTIPMAPQVESLNVAVAAAVLLYSARRQRR